MFIVVFCCIHSASVGRSATFCALKIVVEQVKTEGIIDVFYTVHTMRTRQPLSVRQIVSSEYQINMYRYNLILPELIRSFVSIM